MQTARRDSIVKASLVLPCIIFFLMAVTPAYAASYNVYNCGVQLSGGTADDIGYYYLQNDISTSNSYCIVQTSNTVFNLMGHTIHVDAPPSNCGYGIFLYPSNVTVRNGTISISGSSGNCHGGIIVSGEYWSYNTLIENMNIVSDVAGNGVQLQWGHDFVIRNNHFSGDLSIEDLGRANYNGTAYNNTMSGVSLSTGSSGWTIYSCFDHATDYGQNNVVVDCIGCLTPNFWCAGFPVGGGVEGFETDTTGAVVAATSGIKAFLFAFAPPFWTILIIAFFAIFIVSLFALAKRH